MATLSRSASVSLGVLDSGRRPVLTPPPLLPRRLADVAPWDNLPNMIALPSSRRFRIFGALAVITLVATYIHLRPQWEFEYRQYYESVTDYFSRPVYDNTLYNQGNEEFVQKQYNTSNPCARFPNTDGILLIMKTGATEAFDRVPTQLLTTMSCLPDSKFLLFSDMV